MGLLSSRAGRIQRSVDITPVEEIRRAILVDPSDDGLRYILADELDRAGDSRQAMFIRNQIATYWAESGEEFATHRRRSHGSIRAGIHLGNVCGFKSWIYNDANDGALSSLVLFNGGHFAAWWRRGLVESINTTWPLFRIRMTMLFESMPLRKVVLRPDFAWRIAFAEMHAFVPSRELKRLGWPGEFSIKGLNRFIVNYGRSIVQLPPLSPDQIIGVLPWE